MSDGILIDCSFLGDVDLFLFNYNGTGFPGQPAPPVFTEKYGWFRASRPFQDQGLGSGHTTVIE